LQGAPNTLHGGVSMDEIIRMVDTKHAVKEVGHPITQILPLISVKRNLKSVSVPQMIINYTHRFCKSNINVISLTVSRDLFLCLDLLLNGSSYCIISLTVYVDLIHEPVSVSLQFPCVGNNAADYIEGKLFPEREHSFLFSVQEFRLSV